MSESMKGKIVETLLAMLAALALGAGGILWQVKADAGTVNANIAKVEAVTEEKIKALQSLQAKTDSRLDNIERMISDLPNAVAQRLKGN